MDRKNTVGKAEIARHEQFLLFPQCFQKTFNKRHEKKGLVWERVILMNTLPTTAPCQEITAYYKVPT